MKAVKRSERERIIRRIEKGKRRLARGTAPHGELARQQRLTKRLEEL